MHLCSSFPVLPNRSFDSELQSLFMLPAKTGQKWGDAKDEANESGFQAKEAVKDAAGALSDKTRRGADRAADEARFRLRRGPLDSWHRSSYPSRLDVCLLTLAVCDRQAMSGLYLCGRCRSLPQLTRSRCQTSTGPPRLRPHR